MNDADAIMKANDLLAAKRITQDDYMRIVDGDHAPLNCVMPQPVDTSLLDMVAMYPRSPESDEARRDYQETCAETMTLKDEKSTP